MDKRGPKPKRARIKQLEGNPGKRAVDLIGLEAIGETLVPDHLHDDAKAWIRVHPAEQPSSIGSTPSHQ